MICGLGSYLTPSLRNLIYQCIHFPLTILYITYNYKLQAYIYIYTFIRCKETILRGNIVCLCGLNSNWILSMFRRVTIFFSNPSQFKKKNTSKHDNNIILFYFRKRRLSSVRSDYDFYHPWPNWIVELLEKRCGYFWVFFPSTRTVLTMF
jgi:hypothetical protein